MGRTTVFEAEQQGHVKIVEFLLENMDLSEAKEGNSVREEETDDIEM